jgi:hypothetical protein
MVVESEVGMNWKKEVGKFADLGEGGTENILGGRGCKGGSDEIQRRKVLGQLTHILLTADKLTMVLQRHSSRMARSSIPLRHDKRSTSVKVGSHL